MKAAALSMYTTSASKAAISHANTRAPSLPPSCRAGERELACCGGVLPPTSAKRQLFGRKDHARDDRCARHSVKRSPAAGRRNRRSSAESRAASRPHRPVNVLSCASAMKNTNAALKLQNDLSFVAYFALLTFFTGPSGGPTCWRFFSPAPGAFSVCQLCEAIGRWILMYSASY